jgi:hypothetical protein
MEPTVPSKSRLRRTLEEAMRALGYPPPAGEPSDSPKIEKPHRARIVWDLRRPREKRQVSVSAESMLDI